MSRKPTRWLAAIVIFAFSAGTSDAIAANKVVSGAARVVDGDTLEVAGNKVRIHGIDAPEARQTCQRNGLKWPCGAEAGKAMRSLVIGSAIRCEILNRDLYRRSVGRCKASGKDIGEVLVSLGLAMAYRKYSEDYIAAEARAKASKVGLWSGEFVPPWEWRRGKRLDTAPKNENHPCIIKGNINRSGERIYHLPGGQDYPRTKIILETGERYFCSEAEAVSAGWRKSRR